MNKLLLTGILLIIIFACEENEPTNQDKEKLFLLETPDTIPKIEYDIICHAFDSIVLQQATDFFILPFQTIKFEIQDMDSAVYYNYVNKNKVSYNLNSLRFNGTGIKLISIEERDYLINNPDFNYSWDEFFKKYPDASGLFSISRVGFNTDSTSAMLSYGFLRPLYQMDEILFFKRIDNAWVKTGSIAIQTSNTD